MQLIGIRTFDDGVIAISFNEKKYGDEEGKINFQHSLIFQKYLAVNQSWFFIDRNVWKSLKTHPLKESRVQIYHDGENLKLDLGWEHRLMPVAVIKRRHLIKLESQLSQSLSVDDVDYKTALSLLCERDACAQWSDSQWYQKALEHLNARVSDGDGDKPKIRQKLLSKIQELKS